ncbi:MAG TPA: nitrate- and nitrite sensing domain-containing protein [Streptosporangiaceae bacterium]|nr:nitrate- and nitrite sensing domain-containing protein [Streptosporangiaceae bacterium]
MLHSRSVRLRIIALVILPVIALIGLYGVVLSLTLSSYVSLRQASNVQNDITNPISNVQTQLSTERTIALQYLSDPTHARLNLLIAQEPKTDAAVAIYDTAASAAIARGTGVAERDALRNWSTALATLHELRTTVASAGLTRADAAIGYSALVFGGDSVLDQVTIPLLDTSDAVQVTDIVTLDQSLQVVAEESDLVTADLLTHTFPVTDRQLINQLVVQHRVMWNQALPTLNSTYQSYLDHDISYAASSQLAAMENRMTTSVRSAKNVSIQQWNSAVGAYLLGFGNALQHAADTLRDVAVAQAHSILMRLILTGGFGLLAILVAVTFAVIVSQGLIRQLNDLRLSALDLSSERLPDVIRRLRGGDEIDVDAETPQLRPSNNEIGQVRQAFNIAAKTAITAAVDEVAIRRGVNDVFRNLARRNQSLLARQLQLLDAMERRVHDPEELADLFRVDHLTTRMRRHAEGLLIVAGGSSGRVWREPVPVVDVIRAAVAEVEDYTRVRIASRSTAAVAGHAVADIIHLLAELVENATMFSPANTPVRVDGDLVAKGVVVEIEDRGLGMNEKHLAEINAVLDEPPLFDLSGSDQLGLFIAGQLAKRHEIKISLRASAYGGITAVVLIPTALVVDTNLDDLHPVAGVRQITARQLPELPGPARETVPDRAESPAARTSSEYFIEPDSVTTTMTLTGVPERAQVTAAPLSPTAIQAPAGPGEQRAWEPVAVTGSLRTTWGGPAVGEPGVGEPGDLPDTGGDGLPTRVRQANLAPQLRASTASAGPREETLSPDAARSTMAALQRGWELGRSATEPTPNEPETYEP